jgi:hypothetical protein
MDQSDDEIAVVASLRRSGRLTDADLRHRGREKKPMSAVPIDFPSQVS